MLLAMPESVTIAEHPTALEWLLRPLSRVRPGEGLQAVMLLACVFLLLTSYYMMKTAREGMILQGGAFGLDGAEVKSYSAAGMALLLIGVVRAYSALANRVRRLRLINVSYAVVVACLLMFFALAHAGVAIGLPFFVWIGIANVLLIAQFWSYANDLYSEEQGTRLFPIIATGGSIGAVLGPGLAARVPTNALLLLAVVPLLGGLLLFNLIERIRDRAAPADDAAHQPIDASGGGFGLVRRDRYLLLIAALVLVAELVKTNGEFVLSSVATEHAAAVVPATAHAELSGAARLAAIAGDRREIIKQFYGSFFLWVNLVSLAIQAFAVSRVIDRLGVRRAVFVMPVIALGAYAAIATIGGLALVRVAKVAENSSEYSVENTVRQTLFLPTARAKKYKAKAAIDTFVVRAADVLSAGLVWVGIHALGDGARSLAYVNVALVVLWIVTAARIAHRRRLDGLDRPTRTPV